MGIVERLHLEIEHGDQEHRAWLLEALRWSPTLALIERLKGYAVHYVLCEVNLTGSDCDCGLTALIKEIEGG